MLAIFILTILFQITFTYQKTPLDEYINNEFDIKHVNFKTVSMQLRGNVREYRLNITTLKWLAGIKTWKNLIINLIITFRSNI